MSQQQTYDVGNSMQKSQIPNQQPDQVIVEHSIQETPYYEFDPRFNVQYDKTKVMDVITKIYDYLTFLNKNYELDPDSLQVLVDQGFVKYVQDNGDKIEGQKEKITNEYISDGLYAVISAAAFAQPWLLLTGLVPAIVQTIKYAFTQQDEQTAQDLIDEWYHRTLSEYA